MSSQDKTTSNETEAPRRRRQSATGAVDRLTNVMGRDKPQSSEEVSSTEEDSSPAEEQPPATEASENHSGQEEAEANKEQGSTAPSKSTKKASAASSAKKTRIRASVDLSRDQHKFLKMFAVQNESDGMSILRELVEMLEEEDDIADRLVQRLNERE